MEPEAQPGVGHGISRRRFLSGAGVASAGAALSTVLPATRAEATKYLPVYRLTHEGDRACAACDAHDRYRFYRMARYARRDRAHRYCNCPVIKQKLPAWKWRKFFERKDGTLRKVWDLRWNR